MRLIRDITSKPPVADGCAVAIGNFDGLHLGHRALIERVLAGRPELPVAVMCFEPLPATYFRPESAVPRLTGTGARLRLLRDAGLDLVFMLRFNALFAALSPEAFAKDVLTRSAGARRVVVGEDFRFGRERAGDVEMLEAFGRKFGFEVEVVPPVELSGRRISSSAIRKALAEGDLDHAAGMLGRRYAIGGRVIQGQRLGRELGYPTVNLRVPQPPPLSGIFAVTVTGAGLHAHPAVASLGRRPTVAGREWLLEPHLFDFDGDLYGRYLTVEFVEYLRAEERFEDLASMIAQMKRDEEVAREILKESTDEHR